MTIYLSELNNTPLGDFRLVVSALGLVAVEWAESQPELDVYLARHKLIPQRNALKLAPYVKELREYINGKRKQFTFNIDWSFFTPFQKKALEAVSAIPYGETRTYAQVAIQIGHPNAYRAVGAANGMNPMPLVIPCHRVLGTDGKLHGYGGMGGLKTKEWLLRMEKIG